MIKNKVYFIPIFSRPSLLRILLTILPAAENASSPSILAAETDSKLIRIWLNQSCLQESVHPQSA